MNRPRVSIGWGVLRPCTAFKSCSQIDVFQCVFDEFILNQQHNWTSIRCICVLIMAFSCSVYSPWIICILLSSGKSLYKRTLCLLLLSFCFQAWTHKHRFTQCTHINFIIFFSLSAILIRFVTFIPEMQLYFTPTFRWAVVFSNGTCSHSDSGDSVWWCGSVDPCRPSCWGKGGCCWAGSLCPASPHLSPPGRRTRPECCAAALWYPGCREALGSATLLACGKGNGRQ